MNRLRCRIASAGFTAIELIIVLIVGFSIIAFSASRMGTLFSNSSAVQGFSNILDLYVAGSALSGPNGYGQDGDDLLPALVKTDSIPKSLVSTSANGTPTAVNEWGKVITMSVINGGLGFNINYPGIPKASCASILPQLIKSGNFSAIKVNDQVVSQTASTADALALCVDNSTITVEVNGPETQ